MKKRVLFVCPDNAARSRMGEAWLRHLAGADFDVASAGVAPAAEVHPETIRAMAETGIELETHPPRDVRALLADRWDFVVRMCDRGEEGCADSPELPEAMCWSFRDPDIGATDEERARQFRRVRDEIGQRIRLFIIIHGREMLPAAHSAAG